MWFPGDEDDGYHLKSIDSIRGPILLPYYPLKPPNLFPYLPLEIQSPPPPLIVPPPPEAVRSPPPSPPRRRRSQRKQKPIPDPQRTDHAFQWGHRVEPPARKKKPHLRQHRCHRNVKSFLKKTGLERDVDNAEQERVGKTVPTDAQRKRFEDGVLERMDKMIALLEKISKRRHRKA